jgi:hypothetical protein
MVCGLLPLGRLAIAVRILVHIASGVARMVPEPGLSLLSRLCRRLALAVFLLHLYMK